MATSKSKRAKLDTVDTAFERTARADAELEAVFEALAHRQRRLILLVLNFRGGSMTAGDIAQRFDCAWPTTTRHLRVLEDAGLVHVEERGRERIYHVEREKLRRVLLNWASWFRDRELE
ncbi:metalloregulator ArsR/SmtB family transcription factor [Pendulispora rubella]|uniref:Metalloregulator ArsR/SmtB family transcription factor n=1 Tax=Pendulispora rubella TaxID=2741070 RepID=A0ABZ2LET5_9BACT